MRARHFLPLSILLIPMLAGQALAQTADEVIEKHLAAMGGREALAKLTSRRSTGTVVLTVQGTELKGTFVSENKAPNLTRGVIQIDASALGLTEKIVVEQRFDGTAGVAKNSMQGDTPITGNQLDNMRSNVFPTPLLDYKATGTAITALPRETVGGKELIVLQVTPKAGSVSKVYFDPQTYMVVKSVARVSTPEMGDIEQVNEPSDYRTVDGVKVPFVVTNTNPAQVLVIRLDKVEHNVALDNAAFSVK